ncbi:hypothetical protein RE428_07780 [Marinobacter nanhaiticus D15-8W]|uniref:Transcriptional regulator n=1 Tax=Marinobacter nanhaiticus D15-8W TaxID=626887 RepID=N6VWH0_9GAMM|nr:ogr/Delta-like zinc finger family protein [Marinobacter nanhaiticus]ENO14600.2 transcriptional regulator [Marinobacter nanhaiticus D15-8W]BES69715.1 hypothetical protein RE428_07330 [Marinobacter nanhaiticus D15-8W]BES69760.1 hypothetical protein RE428_07780 [Marinobacter nanhaiticus D15-8W]
MGYNLSIGQITEDQHGMRIECPHCQQKAAITGHNKLSPAVKDVYASCTNADCGWRGVITVSHKHDIQPPKAQLHSMMAEWLGALPAADRSAVLRQAGVGS